MSKRAYMLPVILLVAIVALPLRAQQSAGGRATSNSEAAPTFSAYQQWKNGPSSDPSFFPIAVWLQAPRNAARFREAGINTYVGLYRGPTEEQLGALKAAGISAICAQNEVALRSQNAHVTARSKSAKVVSQPNTNPTASFYFASMRQANRFQNEVGETKEKRLHGRAQRI